ncbi:CobW/HypB/UreG, nucleotide-binding domain-containing protein [Haematococcus lacustris]
MEPESAKTPVTMLSGFLGAGKTTLLRFLLENSKEKIACIVNDVASINIDAKLVRNDRNKANKGDQVATTKDLADTVELANGCACCNMQDELFASFEQVLAMADKRGEPYARIVLENSGVAEPQNIRDKFLEAAAEGHPLLDRIALDTLVTVVDASTFVASFASRQPLAARPDLGDGGTLRPVVDLLVEQVECSDYVILNKVDLMAAAELQPLEQLVAVVGSLNPLATVIPCSQARVPLDKVFGRHGASVVAKLNIEGQHRGAVAAVRSAEQVRMGGEEAGPHDGEAKSHHHHDHHHHDHHHHHDKEAAWDGKMIEADGSDVKDDHHHHHHHHHHQHKSKETTAAMRFGINSFVYRRRRPFHPQRLKEMVLKWLPVTSNPALEGEAPGLGDSPIKTVMRSKGFMWMSNSHATAYYWSHAGQHFEIRDEGDWWAAVPDDDWPVEEEQCKTITADWDMEGPYGDRRQEIVFIGVAMDQEKICSQLDSALLTDEEFHKYGVRWASVADPVHAGIALPVKPATAPA